MKRKKRRKVAKKHRSRLSVALAKDCIDSAIRGQVVRSVGEGTWGLIDTRSFALSMGELNSPISFSYYSPYLFPSSLFFPSSNRSISLLSFCWITFFENCASLSPSFVESFWNPSLKSFRETVRLHLLNSQKLSFVSLKGWFQTLL